MVYWPSNLVSKAYVHTWIIYRGFTNEIDSNAACDNIMWYPVTYNASVPDTTLSIQVSLNSAYMIILCYFATSFADRGL